MKLWARPDFKPIERKRYTWAGTLGTAVLLGAGGVGAAGALGAFGKKKQVAPGLKQTPQLSATAEYPLYKQTLEDRIAGRNLGYDPSVLSGATAPYAKQQREGFQNYTMPQISAGASARGLGRSTIPVSQTRLGSQEVESDIANRVAQLTLSNEQEKATEKTGAIGAYGNLMGQDYNAMVNNIYSQNNQALSAAEVENANRKVKNDTAQQGYQMLEGASLNALSGGKASSFNLGNILSPTATMNGQANQNKTGGLFGTKNAAIVNTGNFTPEEMAFLKSLINQ
jgi:hypothetical protein